MKNSKLEMMQHTQIHLTIVHYCANPLKELESEDDGRALRFADPRPSLTTKTPKKLQSCRKITASVSYQHFPRMLCRHGPLSAACRPVDCYKLELTRHLIEKFGIQCSLGQSPGEIEDFFRSVCATHNKHVLKAQLNVANAVQVFFLWPAIPVGIHTTHTLW
jgi:hypothetical protein